MSWHDREMLDPNQFAGAGTRVAARERTDPAVAFRTVHFDEVAVELDDVAVARALDFAFDGRIGGNQVHVRAGFDDLAFGDRKFAYPPEIEACGLGNGNLVEHRAVRHAPPAEREID